MSRTRAKRLVDDWFANGLSARRWRALRAALDESPEDRVYYDKVANLRAILAGEEALDRSRIDAIAERLFRQLDGKHPKRSYALVWAQFAATIVAIAILVLIPRMRDRDEFQARHGELAGAARAFCVKRGARDAVRSVASSSDAAPTTCAKDDTLQLAYSIAPEARAWARYVFLVGVDSRREPLWYFPDPAEGSSFAAVLGDGEHLASDGIELAVNHQPGALWVYALISSEPITTDDVAAWLRSVTPGSVPTAKDVATSKISVQRIRLELE